MTRGYRGWLGLGYEALSSSTRCRFIPALLDPRHLYRNKLPPPVVIQSIVADGRTLSSSSKLELPARTSDLQIAYAGLSLSVPEHVQFRYRLKGIDTTWQSVGTRRTAYYTKLPPGSYDFQVIASNDAGVWNKVGAELPIRIIPAWYQTWWFKVLVAIAFVGVLALAYRLRIRYIAERMQERHRARLAERDRIARELHDTLLQSTEGLILKVHSVVDQLSVEDPRRALLSASLDRASELAYEGRERIQGLRDGARPRPELAAALEKVAHEIVQGTQMRIELQLEGRVRMLLPHVWEELYRIGYEALWNAYRHARARQITLFAAYGDRELLIRIGDDGGGIAAEALQSAKSGGHFGLAGMHERARALDARLHIESHEGGGTRVEVRINSLLAYVRSAPRHSSPSQPSSALARW